MTLIIEQSFTTNCEPRPDGMMVKHLILHYTGCPTEVASARFMDNTPNLQGGRLSTHYMVDERGRITQFVHEKSRAWHAGKSYWQGETDINSTSIGIEIVNLGEFADYPPFNPDQIDVVINLCRDILKRHPAVTARNVLGHSDIAPGRKMDPGPQFPWAQLAAAGIGYVPSATNPTTTIDMDQALTQMGYNPDVALDIRWTAFCTHYAQEGLTQTGRQSALQKLAVMIEENASALKNYSA